MAVINKDIKFACTYDRLILCCGSFSVTMIKISHMAGSMSF